MKQDIIKAVGDMKSVSFTSYHKNVKGVEKTVLEGTPVLLHKEEESRKGIVMVQFEDFLFLMHCYLNYLQDLQSHMVDVPVALS